MTASHGSIRDLLPTRRRPAAGTAALLLTVVLMSMTAGPRGAAEGVERLFDEGNALYRQGDYQPAADKYLQIEQQGVATPALYYNLGNCYYKLGRIGRSILYYERGLRSAPSDDDIRANLAIAQQATADNVQLPDEFALARWLRSALYALSPSTLGRSLAVAWIALCGLLALNLARRRSGSQALLRGATVALGAWVLLSAAWFGLQSWDRANRVEAIIQVEETRVLSSPGTDGVEVFLIHEGTKVRISQTSGEWLEIVLLDGKVGWVPRTALEVI